VRSASFYLPSFQAILVKCLKFCKYRKRLKSANIILLLAPPQGDAEGEGNQPTPAALQKAVSWRSADTQFQCDIQ